MNDVLFWVLNFIFVLPAIVLHELSHGYAAYRLGDPTAKNAGRLTLNPIKHIDPFGTILLPIMLIVLSGGQAVFGYAKPVPVNPRYFKDYRVGFFITGFAGPTTNIVLAILAGAGVHAFGIESFAGIALYMFARVNLVLVFFNLIPIPPLDGSRIIPLFLSDRAMHTYARVEQYGFGILLAAMWILPSLLRFDPISWYLGVTVGPLLRLLTGV